MSYPLSFYLALLLIGLLAGETLLKKPAWWLPGLVIYATVFVWYFIEMFTKPEKYQPLPELIVSRSFWQVIFFLGVFRGAMIWVERWLRPRGAAVTPASPVSPTTLLWGAMLLWLVLLGCGVYRMEGDLFHSLFPIEGRAGMQMWSRGAAEDAGPYGFLISSGSYLYLLVCSFFGILPFFLRGLHLRLLCVVLVLVTWPSFLLGGTRNAFLAVSLPCAFGYAMFVRHPVALKVIVLGVLLMGMDAAFRVVVLYRGVGYEMLAAGERLDADSTEEGHVGLNMIEELCFVNIYSYVDQLKPTYGVGYMTQLLNFIPRAVWKDKPYFAVEYAKWRGFEGGESDVGVVASIATGLIGQGVMEFGPAFGPIAPGALMALWCGLLTRWRIQSRGSLLRLFVFLAGIGTTFNLGRNITLLVLWPVVFGYLIVLAIEKFVPKPRRESTPNIPPPRARLRPAPLLGAESPAFPAGGHLQFARWPTAKTLGQLPPTRSRFR